MFNYIKIYFLVPTFLKLDPWNETSLPNWYAMRKQNGTNISFAQHTTWVEHSTAFIRVNCSNTFYRFILL